MTVVNWNKTAFCDPAREVTPPNRDALAAIVRDVAGHPSPVRAVGSLHSLNACFTTPGTLVHMKAPAFHFFDEPANGTVRVGAGVTMFELKEFLKPRGLQIAVTPEIGNATAGSVACCGTKDASLRDGPGQISSTVAAIALMDASGQVEEISEEQDPARLRVLRSSYGLFGIVVAVTFRTIPLQVVDYDPKVFDVPGTSLERARGDADGFLAFLFPYNRKLVVERRTLTARQPSAKDKATRDLRNEVWKKGGRPFSHEPKFFDTAFKLFFPTLSFQSLRVDVMIDFPPGGDEFFDFGFWAFPASRWEETVPAFIAFCEAHKKETGFRPDLPTEVYSIRRDDRALLSFSPSEDIFTLDMVHTLHRPASATQREDEARWDEMNRRFNTFAVAHGGRPLLNQTKQLTRDVVRGALGADWDTLVAARAAADPGGRFLNDYFARLL